MTIKSYKHIFFDLDHTLWDFETSAKQTFQQMYKEFKLKELGIADLQQFESAYTKNNTALWELYRDGKLEKDVLNVRRFDETLIEFGIESVQLAQRMAEYYVYNAPRSVYLFPYTREILGYLKQKYNLHLITNGFEEVQYTKLAISGLDVFFTTITTSEEAGAKKPDAEIFYLAFKKANAHSSESVMIGDDLDVDIAGANSVGMDQVYFNPNARQHHRSVTLEIQSLDELFNYF